MILPKAFESRMKTLLGIEYEAFVQAYENEESDAKGLRISVMRLPDGGDDFPGDLMGLLKEQIPWSDMGYYSEASARPGKTVLHEAGLYYLQEPSAMITAALAGVKPGEKVLDLCAAPGGKATALGDALGGEGVLVANEIHPARAKILSENIERMGISNALVLNETPERIATLFPEFFDAVVVDAPCSGEGMFRKEEAALTEWSEENVTMCANRQKEILKEAVKCVAPGGRLIYSTCTFAPAEDEENIEWLLENYPDFSIEVPPEFIRNNTSKGRPEWGSGNTELEKCVRIWPHIENGEGHFAVLLRRSGGTESEAAEEESTDRKDRRKGEKKGRGKNIALTREMRESFENFANETLTEEGKRKFTEVNTYSPDDEKVAALFGDNLYLMPFYFPGKGVKIERAGLHVGTFAKNRFEPSLALARSLRAEDVRNVVNLLAEEKDKAVSYIKGEQITGIDPGLKGWTLLCYEGVSLGFAKAVGGVLKNHYPKGLRKDLG